MKILMYSVRPDEMEWIKAWGKANNCEVDTNDKVFNEDTVDLAKGYDGISVLQTVSIGSEVICKKLADFGIKIMALRSTGYENVDLNSAEKYGITVTNVPGYSPRSVSELVLTQALHLLRHIGIVEEHEARGDFSWGGLEAKEIHQLTVGVIGVGKIGSTSARLFKALGSNVIGYDIYHSPAMNSVLDYVSFDELLARSDIITIHTQLTNETTGMIDKVALKKMKKTAFLINMARGPIIVIDDLIQALKDHEIAGAALDTISNEGHIFGENCENGYDNPPLKELLKMPNVAVTPHIGFYTEPAVQNMVDISLDSILNFKNGKKLTNIAEKLD